MKHLVRLGAILTAYVGMTGTANAVFSGPSQVPEPGSLGLLVAGGVAIMAARYLSKRKDKRDE